jgi:DnaJ-class molecular chaperone
MTALAAPTPTSARAAADRATFNGTTGSNSRRAGQRGGNVDDMFGGGGFSDFFRTIFGEAMRSQGRGNPFGSNRRATSRRRRSVFRKPYEGHTRQLQTNGRKLQVRIPAGVKTGSKVRVAGAGPEGLDLYLVIKVEEDERFEQDGSNLTTTSTVDFYADPRRRSGCGNARRQGQVEHPRRHPAGPGLPPGRARHAQI